MNPNSQEARVEAGPQPPIWPAQQPPQGPWPGPAGPGAPPYGWQPPLRPLPQGRRFTPGTILLPLAFMAIHLVLLNVVMLVYLMARSFTLDLRSFGAGDLQTIQEQVTESVMAAQNEVMLIAMPLLIAIYLLLAYLLRRRAQPYVFNAAPRAGELLRAAVIALGMLGLTNLIMMGFYEAAEQSSFIADQLGFYELLFSDMGVRTPIWIQTLAVAVLVPIAEELLFRGLILGELRRAMSDGWAILINGLLFALFHMNFIQSAYVLPVGLVLAALAVWSRTMWVPVFFHMLFNFGGGIVSQLFNGDAQAEQIYLYIQLGALFFAVFFFVWAYLARRREPASAGPTPR